MKIGGSRTWITSQTCTCPHGLAFAVIVLYVILVKSILIVFNAGDSSCVGDGVATRSTTALMPGGGSLSSLSLFLSFWFPHSSS